MLSSLAHRFGMAPIPSDAFSALTLLLPPSALPGRALRPRSRSFYTAPLGRWAHPKTGRGLGTLANTRTAAVLWLGPRGRRPAHELPSRRRSRLAGDEGSKSG